MTGQQLIAEGRELSRPCVYLVAEPVGSSVAAVWGGPGVLPAPSGSFRHWLTIDAAFLPEGMHARSGCLGIYTNKDEDGYGSGLVVREPGRSLSEFRHQGLPLYPRPAMSLPPIDAVFKFGSPAVMEWLKKNNWGPEWEYNDNFRDRKVAVEYNRAYQQQCPLYTGSAHAVLGGWHLPWPDGDWSELIAKQLIVWTFEDSEPWVEVWFDGQDYKVIPRIT